MGPQKGYAALVQPQPFPDAVAQHEAGIEDRDHGFLSRLQRVVDRDQDIRVARIIRIGMHAVSHSSTT
ncbi:hypothetical protein D3C87_1962130 [compost metagenome]